MLWALLGYAVTIGIATLLKGEFELLSIVLACKTISLAYETRVGFLIQKDEKDRLLRTLNRITAGGSAFVCFLVFLKFVTRAADLQFSAVARAFMATLYEQVYWMVVLPFVALMAIDILIICSRGTRFDAPKKARTRVYLVFVDFACTIPLLIVLILTWIYRGTHEPSLENVELFSGGAAVFLIFAHGVTSNAADIYTDRLEAGVALEQLIRS